MGYSDLSPEAQRAHDRFQTDLKYFCRKALIVKYKEGGDGPFIWNKAQEYLHARIEDQLQRTGRVRMFILKGRQQGISTYIAARLYHKATRQRGKRVFILSHHSSTTETLFQIVDTYHDKCPEPLRPIQTMNNNRQMKFSNKSQYTVGTAGTGDIGRGDTNQYMHWSEVAFSENISKLLTGVFETVADVDGTEKLLESTANGVGNYFHTGCMAAMGGDDEYELVFIPWYWQKEYRAKLVENFELTDHEIDLKEAYELDDNQIQWRRNKIASFNKDGMNGDKKFKQEYPFTVEEAFQASGDPLFNMEKVALARKSKITDPSAPLILGVDPAPLHDRTIITWRRGRQWLQSERLPAKTSQMELAGKLANRIDKNKYGEIAKVFIDVAEGRGCVARLHELGYQHIVMGVAFSQSPNDDEVYSNKRSEMAGLLKDWIEDDFGAKIPDDEEINVELGMIPAFKVNSNGRKALVAKEEIIKAYGRSPDIVDSAMLTFAQPVKSTYNETNRAKKNIKRKQSELSAVNRRRAGRKPKGNDYDDDDDSGEFKVVRSGFRRR